MIEQIFYRSDVATTMSAEDLEMLLQKARAKNQGLEVTGFLLFDGKRFLQLLEGPEGVAKRLYNEIETDNRHQNVHAMVREMVERRCFSNWSMAYAALEAGSLQHFGGTMTSQMALDLVAAMRQGNSYLKSSVADFLMDMLR